MANLRKTQESVLNLSVEKLGVWGLPVELIDPDGVEYTTNNRGEILSGQVLFHRTVINPDTGEAMVVSKPVVTLRRSSLTRIPVDGETWFVRIPNEPDPDATKENYILDSSSALQDGASLGIIRLYLNQVSQS